MFLVFCTVSVADYVLVFYCVAVDDYAGVFFNSVSVAGGDCSVL